jgi:hypothetical protein
MEKIVRNTTKAILVAAAIVGGSLTGAPAMADNVAVGVSPGGIAFGYNDGYWDRDRNWHGWKNHEEAEHFRAENREHYFDRKHDDEKDKGWRDSDRYWDRH